MFRNILVSVDGSAHADQALIEAIDLAEVSNARLTILTAVVRPPAWAYAGPGAGAAMAAEADLEQEAQGILRGAADRVPQGIPLTTILTKEPVREALLQRIDDGCQDLLVMGSRGRGTVRSAVLGSVSQHLLHHSPVPVLVVHLPDAAAPTRRDNPAERLAAAPARPLSAA
jgi:nucleotide-binding universal stress UspA family protein